MKITCKRNGDIKKVTLHPRDTWSLDLTLAKIIAPALKQLRDTTHGSPLVSNEDVPESLHRPDMEEFAEDEHWHQRWYWVLNEMIWSFEKLNEPDFFVLDASKPEYERMQNGFRLFGKYYLGLWD